MLLFPCRPFVNIVNVSLTWWLTGLEVCVISENFQIESLIRSESSRKFENGTISTCEYVIVPEQDPVPPCLIVDKAYLVLRFLMKEFSDGATNKRAIF